MRPFFRVIIFLQLSEYFYIILISKFSDSGICIQKTMKEKQGKSIKEIFIYCDYVYGGGCERVLNEVVSYLADSEKVIVWGEKCTRKVFYEHYPYSVKYLNVDPLFHLSEKHPFLRKISSVVKKGIKSALLVWSWIACPNVFVAFREGSVTRYVSHIRSKAKYAWIHYDLGYYHWTEMIFKSTEKELACLKKYDKVICVSETVKDSVIRTIGDSKNLCVRYNPINVKSIIEQSHKECNYAFAKDRPSIVTVGRLAPDKNLGILIDACHELEKDYSFEMIIVGDGGYKERLSSQIKNLDVKCVKLVGYKDNPYPYILNSDFYISTSNSESYGLAIQEALILGKPVVAVNCAVLKEVFDNRFGIVTDNSKESIKAAMITMLTDKDKRSEYCRNIGNFYKKDDMYESRLEDIKSLLIDDPKSV